jgi:hypothetical protein
MKKPGLLVSLMIVFLAACAQATPETTATFVPQITSTIISTATITPTFTPTFAPTLTLTPTPFGGESTFFFDRFNIDDFTKKEELGIYLFDIQNNQSNLLLSLSQIEEFTNKDIYFARNWGRTSNGDIVVLLGLNKQLTQIGFGIFSQSTNRFAYVDTISYEVNFGPRLYPMISPDKTKIFYLDALGLPHVYNVESNEKIRIYNLHPDQNLRIIKWAPDSKTLFYTNANGGGTLWKMDINDNEPIEISETSFTSYVISPDSTSILYTKPNHELLLASQEEFEEYGGKSIFQLPDKPSDVFWSPDQNLVLILLYHCENSACNQDKYFLINIKEQNRIKEYPHINHHLPCGFSPDSKSLVFVERPSKIIFINFSEEIIFAFKSSDWVICPHSN